MVGHTGRLGRDGRGARGASTRCLGRIVDADRARRGRAIPPAPGALLAITADHGNADEMRDAAGDPVTAHSLNPVPFVLVGRAAAAARSRDGVLADVAPTILELAGLPPLGRA